MVVSWRIVAFLPSVGSKFDIHMNMNINMVMLLKAVYRMD